MGVTSALYTRPTNIDNNKANLKGARVDGVGCIQAPWLHMRRAGAKKEDWEFPHS